MVNPKIHETSRTLNFEGTTGVTKICPRPEAFGFHSADLARYQPYNTFDTLITIK
jgi:hypothetical protein